MEHNQYERLKLKNQLCFPLYACSRETIKNYKPFLDKLGLTYTQYITMLVLWEHERMTVKELGECLFLDSGTLTPLLKKLEAKGLLNRKRSEEDERSLIVTITPAGEQLREQALSVPTRMAQCSKLAPEEAVTLYRLLHKMLDQQ